MLSDIASVVTAVGVLAAVFSLRQSNRERLRQFEAMYIQRYWSIIDRLSLDALRGSMVDEMNFEDQRAIRAYLFLCEDELEMRGRGYIADRTYELWAAGISEQLEQPMFRAVWEEVSQEPAFPYLHLKNLHDQPNDYKPLKMNLTWRWLRGLKGIGGP